MTKATCIELPTACRRCGHRYNATTGTTRRYDCGSDVLIATDPRRLLWRHSTGCNEIMQYRNLRGVKAAAMPPPTPPIEPDKVVGDVPDLEGYLSMTEAAKVLGGVAPNYVRDLLRLGKLKGGKMQINEAGSRRMMVTRESVEAWRDYAASRKAKA